MPLFGLRKPPDTANPKPLATPSSRVLFLDDDLVRAETFLGLHPEAVWVQTASECIARLEEAWDEVHLDHDLGGEQFVDSERDDCGMAVVRWIVESPRAHLRKTQFIIHSHNLNAATMMGFQMSMSGHKVEIRPFGTLEEIPAPAPTPPGATRKGALAGDRRFFFRRLPR